MRSPSNIRPGRSRLRLRIRSVANRIRSGLYFSLRCSWVRRRGMVRIPWSVDLWSPHRDISLGDRVQFGRGCIVHCDTAIGNSVLLARNVAIIGRNDHRIDLVGKTIWDSPRGDTLKVFIEDDVWIGHGSIILSGVRIGRGSVIGAGSVVSRDVPRYSIVCGVPARVIGQRFGSDQIQEHERILGCYDSCETVRS